MYFYCMIPEIESYEAVKGELKFFATSGVRIKLLISLNKEKMTVDQMRSEFGYRTSTILPVLAELKSRDLIHKDGGYYEMTPSGKLIASKLVDFIETLYMFKTQERFWKNHETYTIPDLFFKNVSSISRSHIMEHEPADIFAIPDHFMKMLEGCKIINGVSPFLHPDFPGMFSAFAEHEAAVRLVLTRPVLELACRRYSEVLQHVEGMPNFSLRVIDEDVKVAFTVTENILSLGFFRLDGTYDYNTDLVSEDAAAIEWGNMLFEYYWQQSTDVTLQDFD